MTASPTRGLALLLLAAACGDPPVTPRDAPTTLVVAGGDAQAVAAGAALAEPLAVRVVAADGAGVPGVRVRFRADGARAADLTLADSVVVTDGGGRATVRAAAAAQAPAGSIDVRAEPVAGAAGGPGVAFTVRLVDGPRLDALAPAAAAPGDTVRLRGVRLAGSDVHVTVGDVPAVLVAADGDTGLRVIVPPCLAAGVASVRVVRDGAATAAHPLAVTPGAAVQAPPPFTPLVAAGAGLDGCLVLGGTPGDEWLVVAHLATSAAPIPRAYQLAVDGGGAPLALRPPAPLSARAAAAGPPWAARRAGLAGEPADGGTHAARFHDRLRARERDPRASPAAPHAPVPAAPTRAPMPHATARATARAVPALGDRREFRAIADFDATRHVAVAARLRFVGARVLVYQDEAGGFEEAVLARVGPQLDGALAALVEETFGPPTDVDGNGRAVVLLTPRVNALTQGLACVGGTVAGYFDGRDLTSTDPATSNRGEVFFGAVPDPTARWGCPLAADRALSQLAPVFVHEYQHLVSYGQHVVARGGSAEAIWLDEGLSHLAEDLVSERYEARFPAPSGRTDPTQLFPDSAQPYLTPNLRGAYDWLSFPGSASPIGFADVGTRDERGAAWLFARWLATRHPGAPRRLVQSSRRGVANVEAATGRPFGALYGAFALAAYLGTVPRLDAAPPTALALQPRDLREAFARLAARGALPAPVPHVPTLLGAGGAVSGVLVPGGVVPVRVRIGASGTATLRFTGAGPAPFAASLAPQLAAVRLPR